jgi:hypothetical protein
MEIGILAIVAVNAGVLAFWWLVRPLRRGAGNRAFIGYYLVLMPAGFAAWQDPHQWFNVGLAAAGLIVVTRACIREPLG